MTTPAPVTFQNLFGLFELDSDGKIIYSRDISKLGFAATNTGVIGRNFFDDIALIENIEEFRKHFDYFIKSDRLTENFIFDCRYGKTVIPVKVKLSQVGTTDFNQLKKLFIVDIRKA